VRLTLATIFNLCLLLGTLTQTGTAQTGTPFQQLEFRCANTLSLTHLGSAPEQFTLIFDDAFYPMKRVENLGTLLRYEDDTLVWTSEDGVGRLEQKDGKVLAEQCVVAPPVLRYSCLDDVTVNVTYVRDLAQIQVVDPVYGEQDYELPKVVTASGAKFSNGVTTWLVAGENANLFEETEEVQHAQDCQLDKP
jgi:membrane-bound inhibitor of C-type lysozyme